MDREKTAGCWGADSRLLAPELPSNTRGLDQHPVPGIFIEEDRVTALGTDVDRTVRRIATGFQPVVLVRPAASPETRAEALSEWPKMFPRDVVTAFVAQWGPKPGVSAQRVVLQRMTTRWGGCNHPAGNSRLNTERVKKPRELVEYVVVHDMLPLIEPTHRECFVRLHDKHLPVWREAQAELNPLPLADEMRPGWRRSYRKMASSDRPSRPLDTLCNPGGPSIRCRT
jgi:predicted metal-dependent hydrolase